MRFTFSKFTALFVFACSLFLSAHAAWYWPFDFDPDSTNKPPRLHRLLEKANEYIELAEDDVLEGNGEKAIANYRLALKELDRVEEENPDRAESPEFAPLRTKRATCSAAIDTIRFAQVNENERAVAVSNTTDLERRWRVKHGLQTLADEAFVQREAAKTNKVENLERPVEAPEAETNRTAVAKTPSKNANPGVSAGGGDFDEQVRKGMEMLRAGDYAGADLLFEKLMKERDRDLNLMLLRAAAQAGGGSLFAARRMLEKAMRLHPKSYLPCYNLANLVLQIDRRDVDVAREYYDMGRELGGPRNEALEKRLDQR